MQCNGDSSTGARVAMSYLQVISSLKRALQPAVTDVQVEFQLTSGFEDYQAPAKIPTIFKGDKIVVYGILKSKAASDAPLEAGVTGTATLKGRVSGVSISHSVSFSIPSPPSAGERQIGSLTGFEMPVLHHLASKSLLNDWSKGFGWSSTALTGERKQEMIQLSIESSVVCEHTAFVAYDVDQSQAIEGAIQVWDLTAAMAEQQQVAMQGYFGALGGGGGGGGHGRGGGVRYAYANVRAMSSSASPMKLVSKSRKKGSSRSAPLPPQMNVLCSSAPPPLAYDSAPPPPPGAPLAYDSAPPLARGTRAPPPPSGPAMPLQLQQRGVCIDEDSASDDEEEFCDMKRPKKNTSGSSVLSLLISFQQAAGFWLLEEVAKKIIKKEDVMKPPQGVAAEVWATVLALTYLDVFCAGQKDEWELIAMKAEFWLEGQSLQGVTLPSLRDTAKNLITK